MNMTGYPKHATIEIFRGGRWQPIAKFRPIKPILGYRGASNFEYLHTYAIDYAGPNHAKTAGLSCRFPVDFDLHSQQHWPAFMLDILPSGYGRQQWLNHLELKDGALSDWPLLLRGTAFPPGNLRIAEAAAAKDLSCKVPMPDGELVLMDQHPGFTREEVLNRDEYFIEYAYQHGIYAAGGSDVQGVAPKLLMTQDFHGAWHAEGVLPDGQIKTHWLIKRPRGHTAVDRKVLRNEAAYMAVAREMGLHVYADLTWERDTLFVPRFDRIVNKDASIERLGMESLCSLAGIAEYGVPAAHDVLCLAIINYSSNVKQDLIEYIKRDILNVVMGNKDNHARNSAVIRREDGTVNLAPLFDFAPMYLDPEGIARVCRWSGDAERGGTPIWSIMIERYQDSLFNAEVELRQFGEKLIQLPNIMRQKMIDEDIVQHHLKAIENHSKQLLEL